MREWEEKRERKRKRKNLIENPMAEAIVGR